MYEYLISRANIADTLARAYLKNHDIKMFTFWTSAAEGYRIKAYNLAVGDAE